MSSPIPTATAASDNDWKYVGRTKPVKGAPKPQPTQPAQTINSKWGGSALRKTVAEPTPKSRDEEFPVLTSGGAKAPSPPTISNTTNTSAPLSMAERMKRKLAEEEEAQRLKDAEEARRAEQTEAEQTLNAGTGFITFRSIMASRSGFEQDQSPIHDYSEYPDDGYDSYDDHADHAEYDDGCDDDWREV